MFSSVKNCLARCSLATRWALLAVLATAVHAWLGLLLALVAAWQHETAQLRGASLFADKLAWWASLPVVMALVTLAYGQALPTDDLMRHLSAWQLHFDYRAQYPWSDLPKADLWLGFDSLLGTLQQAGVPPRVLLQWLPAAGFVLSAAVLYAGLLRAAPRHHLSPELVLLLGALGLLLTTPRMLLGRPEAFFAVLGGAAWLCRTRGQALAWVLVYLAAIPGYWLGWAYAPFALLLPGPWRHRAGRAVSLGLAHLLFWQWYTGDYPGLLLWLKGTLSVPATENAPQLTALAGWASWVFLLLASWALALRLRRLTSRRLLRHLPVLLLLLWLALPNQVRYQPALVFALLPWLARTLSLALEVRRRRGAPLRLHPILVMAALAVAGLQQVARTEPAPTFALGANARVYSEQPYATVYYGKPGIAVEPSFALGATRPDWKGLAREGAFDCRLAQRGGFTHLVEKSLGHVPPCATLQAVQGPWRLWAIQQE